VILDRLDRCDIYRKLGDRFAVGFDYLRSTDFSAVADGRYWVRGDEVYAIVQTYDTKPREQGRWEGHRTKADIQYVIRGREAIGHVPVESATTDAPYDAEKDLEFFTATGGQFVRVEQGSFALFLPHDVHMPNVAIDRPARVKKVVVKVRLT
jgi:YhcH/YjgK/YiaL family protein